MRTPVRPADPAQPPHPGRRVRARTGFAALSALLLVLMLAGTTLAAWAETGSGKADGRALTMPAGQAPTEAASTDGVSVRWPALTLQGGVAVEGYVVHRTDASGASSPAGGSCAGVVATTACLDTSVPVGTWTYTDTPVLASWSGARSPQGNAVTVP